MRCLPFILLAALSTFLAVSCSDNPGSNTVVNGYVAIEVDQQEDQDPFGQGGESAVRGIFPGCAKPEFFIDDEHLQEAMIDFAHRWEYYREHQAWVWIGDLYVPECPYYLCGITQFGTVLEGDTIPDWSRAGHTDSALVYATCSFVCKAVNDNAGGQARDELRLKTCCHELGHQLALLPHLCLNGQVNPKHSDASCLMGQYAAAQCGDHDSLLINIHFCDSCRSALCRAKGVEEL